MVVRALGGLRGWGCGGLSRRERGEGSAEEVGGESVLGD